MNDTSGTESEMHVGPHPGRLRGVGALCGLALSLALVAGCGDGDGDGGGSATSSTPSAGTATATGQLTEDQSERKALVPSAKVGYERAAAAASEKVPGSRLVSEELKRAAGAGPQWHIEVAAPDGTAHVVRVDAVSGKVLESRAKADQDDGDKQELADRLSKAKVSPQDAAATALGRTKGTVTAVELDDTDVGAVIWSVDVVTTGDWNKTTFDVDATHRKILREHVDRD
ncbi:PepSY domain-containing protein [Streptomyces syringium]|uniref:PepSY domain-containing protein n=1 Tax=Streptomyces syringium TaxID=76729 RepID=UPI0037D34E97